MARVGYGRHVKVVNLASFPDDDSYQVGTNEWNDDISPKGMLGFTPTTSTTTISGGALLITDSICVVAAESSNSDDLDSITLTNTSENDLIYLFADAGDTITLEHGGQSGGLNVNGEVSTVSGSPETLSETKPTILIRRGNYWYGYGGGTVDDASVTFAKIQNLATMKVIGRTAGSSGVSSEVALLDEDNMATDSATSLATQQSIKAYVDSQTHEAGDITGVTAGTGLTGGGTSGTVTVDVIGGTGITANANDIAIDSTVATLTGTQTVTNKTLTSPVLNTGVSGTAVLDEDNFASDSATKLATQQSIKAYIATQVSVGDITSVVAGTGLTGGATSGDATVNVIGGTGITANADDIAIDSTVTTLTGSQTLTNKSLTAPALTGAATAVDVAFSGRLKTDKGADVASGTATTLGADGNTFDITGTTTIVTIPSTNWAVGNIVHLQFDGVLTVTHSSATDSILLGDQSSMTTAAGDVLSLFFNGTNWVEVSRSSVSSGGGMHEIQDFDLRTAGQITTYESSRTAGTDGYMYIKEIDDENDGLFVKIKKNDTAWTEVQLA